MKDKKQISLLDELEIIEKCLDKIDENDEIYNEIEIDITHPAIFF